MAFSDSETGWSVPHRFPTVAGSDMMMPGSDFPDSGVAQMHAAAVAAASTASTAMRHKAVPAGFSCGAAVSTGRTIRLAYEKKSGIPAPVLLPEQGGL
jgi:hypothetical protein